MRKKPDESTSKTNSTASQDNQNPNLHHRNQKQISERTKEKLSRELNDILKERITDVREFIRGLQKKYKLPAEEIVRLLTQEPESPEIPLSIFSEKISSLESITKYLIEEKRFSFKKTASLLNRNERTIWTTYFRASKKNPEPLSVKPGITIPISVISNRRMSVLESIVSYLHRELKLPLHEIALIVHRDQRTIWTIKHRAEKKALAKGGNV